MTNILTQLSCLAPRDALYSHVCVVLRMYIAGFRPTSCCLVSAGVTLHLSPSCTVEYFINVNHPPAPTGMRKPAMALLTTNISMTSCTNCRELRLLLRKGALLIFSP